MPTYIRFVTRQPDPRTHRPKGIFTALYELEREGLLESYEVAWFHSAEQWLNANLATPTQLSRSRKRGASRKAITWVKSTAVEHVSKLRELAQLLDHKEVQIVELRTTQPGYIVYEDQYQVAAEPFVEAD